MSAVIFFTGFSNSFDSSHLAKLAELPLCDKYPNTEFFLGRILLYSLRIRESTDQKNLRIYVHFTRNL